MGCCSSQQTSEKKIRIILSKFRPIKHSLAIQSHIELSNDPQVVSGFVIPAPKQLLISPIHGVECVAYKVEVWRRIGANDDDNESELEFKGSEQSTVMFSLKSYNDDIWIYPSTPIMFWKNDENFMKQLKMPNNAVEYEKTFTQLPQNMQRLLTRQNIQVDTDGFFYGKTAFDMIYIEECIPVGKKFAALGMICANKSPQGQMILSLTETPYDKMQTSFVKSQWTEKEKKMWQELAPHNQPAILLHSN